MNGTIVNSILVAVIATVIAMLIYDKIKGKS